MRCPDDSVPLTHTARRGIIAAEKYRKHQAVPSHISDGGGDTKTAHLVVGMMLIISGVLLAAGSTFLTGRSCTNDPAMAQLFGIPLCGPIATQIVAVAGAGLLFLIIGIVVLATGQEKKIGLVSKHADGPVIVPYPAVPQQVAQVPTKKACPMCGTVYGPEAQFCQKDATPLQP